MATNLGNLVIMAKNPTPGQVKTRLIPALGAKGAADFYAAMLVDIVAKMVTGPWQTTVAIHPPESALTMLRNVAEKFDVLPQRGCDLTERMIAVFDDLFTMSSPVVMRNSDSPTLPASFIKKAFQDLQNESTDVVLGPDFGGGYYLVGLKKPCPEMFRTAMSTKDNFEQTLTRCEQLELKVKVLPPHDDVDTPADLKKVFFTTTELKATCPSTLSYLEHAGLL